MFQRFEIHFYECKKKHKLKFETLKKYENSFFEFLT